MVAPDATVGTDVAYLETVGRLERWQFTEHGPWGGFITGGGGMHVECFVWAFKVECLAEAIECALLGTLSGGQGASSLGFERPVHPFIAAVLLGFTGVDELRQDAQAHPPR